MSRLTRFFAATAAASLALVLGACGSTPGANNAPGGDGDRDSVRIGTQPWLGYGQWYVAKDRGLFETQGIDAKLESFQTDADVNAALASGKLDMASVASHTALQFVENGVDVKVVMLMDAATTADAILTYGSVKDVAGLKGKSVAYEEGATSELLLGAALDKAGLSFSDIKPVPMGADEAGAALLAGKTPAAVTYEPYVSSALAANDKVTELATAKDHEGLISDVLVVRSDVLKNKPGAVKKAVRAWMAALDYYGKNTAEAQGVIAAGVGAKPEELKTAFRGVHFYSAAENKKLLAGEYRERVLPLIIDTAKRVGMLKGTVSADDVIDSSFLPGPGR